MKRVIAHRGMKSIKNKESFLMSIVQIDLLKCCLLRTDPEAYDDKKQKHLKRFHPKVVTKIELN
jgi:hypothetical protein